MYYLHKSKLPSAKRFATHACAIAPVPARCSAFTLI